MDVQGQNELQVSDMSQEVETYINYYGLTGDPFDPEKPLFFATQQLEKSLRLFNYLARFSRKLVVVTGPDGAGKSALLKRFIEGQDGASRFCFFKARSDDSAEHVLVDIARQLNVPDIPDGGTREQLKESIQSFALACQDRDIHCMVAVEEAEKLDSSVLEMLYQLAHDDSGQRCGMSLLLCGLPALIDLVRLVVPMQLAEKTVFHQPISPFTREEVVQCLRFHFIENAGVQKPPFSQAEYDAIYDRTEGLPGRIGPVAQEMLLAGVSGALSAEDSENKRPKPFVMVLVASLLLAVALFLWWQFSGEPRETGQIEPELIGQIDRLADEAEVADEELFADAGKPALESDAAGPEEKSSAAEVDSAVESFEAAVALERTDELNAETLTVAEPVTSETVNKEIDSPVTEASALEEPEAEEIVAKPVKEVSAPTPMTRLQADQTKILAFNPTGYTKQLLGSHKESSILKVLDSMGDSDQAMYFKKLHKGEPWYVLVYGYYPDKASANKAPLPKPLQGFKPWVRSVSGIQETIKKTP